MAMNNRALRSFIRAERVGRLATIDPQNRPVVVPFCFVYSCEKFYSPLDEKPKSVAPGRLARVRNIRSNPEVAIVLDHYEEDWSNLTFVLVRGRAKVILTGKEHARAVALLRRKYRQYRIMDLASRPILKIVPWKIVHWSARKGKTEPAV